MSYFVDTISVREFLSLITVKNERPMYALMNENGAVFAVCHKTAKPFLDEICTLVNKSKA